MTWRSLIIITICGVAVLEIIFTTASLFGKFRPFTFFDIEFVVVMLLTVTTIDRKEWHWNADDKFDGRQVLFRVCAFASGYVMLIKFCYFLGFGAHALKHFLFPPHP